MSTQPQTEEYLAARRESCRLLGLNADDLSPHEAIRADLLTVLRLWLDNSQTTLLGGGTADAGKLLSVAEALTKFIPEPESKNHRVDPRERMLKTYQEMRARGADAGLGYDGLQRENERLRAENAQLRAGTADEQQSVAAMDEVVRAGHALRLSRPPHERTAERSAVSP